MIDIDDYVSGHEDDMTYEMKNVLVVKDQNGIVIEIEPFNWIKIKIHEWRSVLYGLGESEYIIGQVCSIQEDDVNNILLQTPDKLMRNVYLEDIKSIKKLK